MPSNVRGSTSFEYEGRSYTFSGYPDEYVFNLLVRGSKFYEQDLLETIQEIVSSSEGLAVDVGANIGNHAVYFAAVLGREVLAIEPDALNFQLLTENLTLNSVAGHVEARNVAAWSRPTTVALEQRIAGNRGTMSAAEASTGVGALPLDDMVGERKVGLIKIDVEGAELEVLRGAARVIERDHPLVVVEAHGASMRSELADFLEPRAYEALAVGGNSDNYVWIKSGELSRAVARRLDLAQSRTQTRILNHINALSGRIEATVGGLEKDLAQVATQTEAAVAKHKNEHAGAELEDPGTAFALGGAVAALEASIDRISDDLPRCIQDGQERLARLQETAARELKDNLSSLTKDSAEAWSDARERWASLVEAHELASKDSQAHWRALGEELAELKESQRASNEETNDLLEERGRQQAAAAAELLDRIGGVETGQRLNSQTLGDLRESMERGLSSYQEEHRLQDRASRKALGRSLSRLENSIRGIRRELKAHAKSSPSTLPSTNLDSEESGKENHSGTGRRYRRAAERFAGLLEREAPEKWNKSALIKAIERDVEHGAVKIGQEFLGTGDIRPVGSPLVRKDIENPATHDRVRVGIASMPGREKGLAQVLRRIAPQADEVFVYLNCMDEVPKEMPDFANVRFFSGPDLGDRGKFAFMEGYRGYYLTCDDDIDYPPFYVQHVLDGIERYDRSCIVGWHGSIFSEDFKEFYNSNYRKVLSFRFLRGKDTPVHLLGTGICGFHTDTIDVALDDFSYPNMADVFLAIQAQRQQVGMVVLAHEGGWANPIDVGPSISSVSLKKDADSAGGLDVAATVSGLVRDNMPWVIHERSPVYSRKPFTLAFVGRTDKERWKKGGILKSAHLTVAALARFGVKVHLEDIVTGDPRGLSNVKADMVMVYVGDPDRPDFKNVKAIVEHHLLAGRHVLVNLSLNGMTHRSASIRAIMSEWVARFGRKIWLMVFTQSVFAMPEFAAFHENMVLVPKTIVSPSEPCASFHSSEGVFIGDIGKLNNSPLLDYSAEEWIVAIRSALPGVKIYGVKQYAPGVDRGLEIDEVWPFMTPEEFPGKIGQRRLMVSLVKYATFEMVPIETAGLGVPVIYPDMPQSLSEHLGTAGIVARTPEELSRVLPIIYNDPMVWRAFSDAGVERARSAELEKASGQMYLQLRSILSLADGDK